MSNGIDLKGVNEVAAQYDYRETPFFAVYQGKDLKFYNVNDDIEAARSMLLQHLEQLEKNGSTAPFKIVWYKKLKTDSEELEKSSELGSNTFRVVQPGMSMQAYHAINRGDDMPQIISGSSNKILEALNSIESRLTAIENPLNEEEEEQEIKESGTQKLMGAISGIINNPSVQEMIAVKLASLLNMIPTSQPVTTVTQNTQPMKIEEKDLPELNSYLQNLLNAGMGLNDFRMLSDLSIKNPSQFAWLLSMLKTL